MANYKRKRRKPRSVRCSLCMSKKLAFGRIPDKEKKIRKALDKELKKEL